MDKPPKKPLYSRVFRHKHPSLRFFCPLCRTERSLLYTATLTRKNYLQIFIISLALATSTFPLMKERAVIWFFIVWITFEAVLKILFRHQVPCPHCGFDATWYKKDVKVARKLVEQFWQKASPPPSPPPQAKEIPS